MKYLTMFVVIIIWFYLFIIIPILFIKNSFTINMYLILIISFSLIKIPDLISWNFSEKNI